MKRLSLFLFSYIIVVFALFLFSFTQVDLSLTLSQSSFWQILQKQFQYLGFFNRPLSSAIFSVIAVLLFVFYLSFLYLAKKDKLKLSSTKILVLVTFIILVFSYNAFSYDLFNYIFDAKILTHYGQNPYLHKPLDFVQDPMLNFMRWTHRLYPYGPSWLILTVPLSFIGLNFFLPTFFLFKLLIGLTYLGSVYLIYKISKILFPGSAIFNTVFFAFNPLVLIEGLVSAHNDFPLVFFALLAIYLYLVKRKILSFVSLIFSIGIKFSTGALLPVFGLIYYLERTSKKIPWESIFLLSVVLSLVAVIFATLRTTFQPWYLIFPISMGAFISRKYYIFIPTLISSIFLTALYVAYVYMTDYAKDYPEVAGNIVYGGLLIMLFTTVLFYLINRFSPKH
ncbi:MAG: hypothetical protein HY344_02105 [Candidatus Levybacteria bacterium]|nr:hypothetical protein [Candidatus Levybacteria bacterium]